MNFESENKPSVLAPLADEYRITPADDARITAKLEAELATKLGVATSPRAAAPGGDVSAAGTVSGAGKGRLLPVVGLACVALVVVGALALRSSVTVRAVSAPTASPGAAPQRPIDPRTEAPIVPAAPVVPSISVDELPIAPQAAPTDNGARNAAPRAPSASDPAAPSSDTLAREARLLSEARRALNSGDAAGALARLDEHARLFPRGWLENDRAAERIVVLCSLGRQADAAREGAVFLQGRPKSTLTHRVEASCAGARGEP